MWPELRYMSEAIRSSHACSHVDYGRGNERNTTLPNEMVFAAEANEIMLVSSQLVNTFLNEPTHQEIL